MDEDPGVFFYLRFAEAGVHSAVSKFMFLGSAFVFLTQPALFVVYSAMFCFGILLYFTSGLLDKTLLF